MLKNEIEKKIILKKKLKKIKVNSGYSSMSLIESWGRDYLIEDKSKKQITIKNFQLIKWRGKKLKKKSIQK